MQGITFKVSAKYGSFKRPECNDNPSTYSFMHKVALIGLIGAVNGIERKDMAPLFPQLCEDLIYSIKILNPIRKESHAFTKRGLIPKNFGKMGRRYNEYLRDVAYEITVALKNVRSKEIFDLFCKNIKEDISVYPNYLGQANCPAFLQYIKNVTVSEEVEGDFETDHVFSAKQVFREDSKDLDLMYDWVPTHVVNSFYSKIIQVVWIQPSLDSKPVKLSGPYNSIDGEKSVWFM